MDTNEATVEESLLRFIEAKEQRKFLGLILKKLENDEIQIGDCHGQAFDNVAVIAGHRSDVQKRISEVNPKALSVPCPNDSSLNLTCVHAASVVLIQATRSEYQVGCGN